MSQQPEPEVSEEPARKRARITTDGSDSYLLTRQVITLKRTAFETAPIPHSLVRTDVGDYIKLQSGKPQQFPEVPLLCVEPTSKSKQKVEHVLLETTSFPTSVQKLCIDAFAQRESREREGAIWARVDLQLDHVDNTIRLQVSFSLYWNVTRTPSQLRTKKQRELSGRILAEFFPGSDCGEETTAQAWTPLDFYDAAFVPPVDDSTAQLIKVEGLKSSLFSYQKRTLQWLLKREGAVWNETESRVSTCTADADNDNQYTSTEPLSFSAHKLSQGPGINGSLDHASIWISRLYHVITNNVSQFSQLHTSLKGGILSEEMGLGKTLEIIGLILLHRRRLDDQDPFVTVDGRILQRSGATLIVCPGALQQQWLAELERHAPHLMVSYYPGRNQMGIASDDVANEQELVTLLAHQDVVLTTYNVLRTELHYAMEPPDRSRRKERAHPRPKSPLMQISWWRVCLDEAQMIESGVSSAALVARVLHRVNAWGVTGTPVKSDVKDLLGLLLFLRYEPYSSLPHVWAALTKRHKDVFRGLFNRISIRHTKQLVRDEIALPAQKRFVITMPFTAVEQQHYGSLFNEMVEACDLDADGNPVLNSWEPSNYEERMRAWLNRLRQAALHPEVGIQNRRALGHKSGPLRTIDEVLTAMIEQNDSVIRTEQRNFFQARLTHGQLLENGPRVREAQEIWVEVRAQAEELVDKCRRELAEVVEDSKESRTVKALKGNSATGNDSAADDSDSEAEDVQNKGKLSEASLRLRNALEIQHKAVFFCANGYFQIKSNTVFTPPDSEQFQTLQAQEDKSYDDAKRIRREILSENLKKAMSYMKRFRESAKANSFVTLPGLKHNNMMGLESASVLERAEGLYGLLILQADVIDEWREAIIQHLLRPLVDEEDDVELTGEEFADSTKIQEELMVFVQVLRAAIADRQLAISGIENALVRHEAQVAKNLAQQGEGPAPDKFRELFEVREKVRPEIGDDLSSLRGVIAALRTILSRLPRSEKAGARVEIEREIVSRQIKDMSAQIASQTKTAKALERECERFTSAMNARVDYYRQLQYVSDSVEPYEGERDAAAIAECRDLEAKALHKLTSAEGKQRYRKLTATPAHQGTPFANRAASLESSRHKCRLRRAPNVHHLPVKLRDGSIDGLRASVLQGVHHAMVPSSPQLSHVQETT